MTARLVTASDGALLGFGLAFGITGHWLGWVIAAGGALIMAADFVKDSHRFKRWRWERRVARCTHDWRPIGRGFRRCRHCLVLTTRELARVTAPVRNPNAARPEDNDGEGLA
jgi:hypothetical protein